MTVLPVRIYFGMEAVLRKFLAGKQSEDVLLGAILRRYGLERLGGFHEAELSPATPSADS